MIRFGVVAADLMVEIDTLAPTWRSRAATKTAEVNASGKVGDSDGIWSEIKAIYMRLQGYKCMYCEKPMPKSADDGASGKVEYDVEHFRPKNRAAPWPTAHVKQRRSITYDSQLRAGITTGYTWLAFDPLNYGVSCKTCNSELKGDRFPILGNPGAAHDTGSTLDQKESPCLILPILDTAEDPESLLEWRGPFVSPKKGLSAKDQLRAQVIIDFFELDTRRDLIEQRCQAILLIAPELRRKTASAREFVAALTAPEEAWAGCLRGFAALHRVDPKEAQDWARRCKKFIVSKNPAALQ